VNTITLSSGAQIPQLGIGVYQVRSADCGPALAHAFGAGYRSVDTANAYLNERAVGEAIRVSGLPRAEIFSRRSCGHRTFRTTGPAARSTGR